MVFFSPIKSGHFCHCFIECVCLLCWERSRGGGGSCTGSLREHLHTPSGSLFADLTAPVSHCSVVTERKQEQAEAPEAHELGKAPCPGLQFLRSDTVVPLYAEDFCKTRWGSPLLQMKQHGTQAGNMEQPPPVLAYCFVAMKPSHLILTTAQ